MELVNLVHIMDDTEKNLLTNILLEYGLDKNDLKNFFASKTKLNSSNIRTKYNLEAKINYFDEKNKIHSFKYKKFNLSFLIFKITNQNVNNMIKQLESSNFYLISQRFNFAVFTNFDYLKINEIINLPITFTKSKFLIKYPKINQNYLKNINDNTKVKDQFIIPQLLLNSKRFDVLIKLHYLRLKKKSAAKEWRDFCYSRHIRHITGPSLNVKEYDGTGKIGEEMFFEIFDKMISSSNNNFPPISIDEKNILIDGSHRASLALVNDCLIKVGKFDFQSKNNDNYFFFINKHGKNPALPLAITDEAAIEASRVKKGLRIVLLFPSIFSKKFAIEYLRSKCDIIYNKSILVNKSAGREILKEAYLGHSQIKSKSNMFEQKVKNCFIFKGNLTVLLIQNFDISSIISIKDYIRNHYSIGHDSIHITDSEDELSRLSKILLNNNSLEFITNLINLDKKTYSYILDFRNWLELNNLNPDDFVIGGSALLGLMGSRTINDLDFLYAYDYFDLPNYPNNVHDHSNQINHYKLKIDELIYDPRNYFWYMGVKFCTPSIILKMKLNRAEDKDILDAKLIHKIVKKNISSKINFQYFLTVVLLIKIFYRKLRRNISPIYRLIKRVFND